MLQAEAMSRTVLCLNCGSSSLKVALYQLRGDDEWLLAEGAAEGVGASDCRLWIRAGDGQRRASLRRDGIADHAAAVEEVFSLLQELDLPQPHAVGHRVVHGGVRHVAPERLTPSLLKELRQLATFAPLHLPAALEGMAAVSARLPHLPQVACFDTAFHRRMPREAQQLALPGRFWDEGLRRYGFHGLSYEYIVEVLGKEPAQGRVIVAHLGSGASLAAVRDGQPLDTTMGFTPTGGFMMGSRSGDLDPGILIHLMRAGGYDASGLERLVNHEAGLLGVSGLSSDMKVLLAARHADPQADQAIRMFCYQIRKQIGAFAAVLNGLDTLVFTGGIGERAAPVRWEICQGLEFLGLRLERQRNEVHSDTISEPESPCQVRVMATDEDLVIARHTRKLIFPSRSG